MWVVFICGSQWTAGSNETVNGVEVGHIDLTHLRHLSPSEVNCHVFEMFLL